MVSIDEIDKRILAALQENSKVNIKALADDLNLTKTPVYERIRRMEQAGIIGKYVAVLERTQLPSSMVVFCSVSLNNQQLESIRAFSHSMKDLPEVLECYLMGGSSDFLLKVVVKDLNEYHFFASGKLAALPHVDQIKSTFVLSEEKNSSVYPVF